MPTFTATSGTAPEAVSDAAVPVAVIVGETVADVIGAAVQVERMIAQLHGIRAELVEQARALNELTADPRRDRAHMGKRAFVSELACALRVSDRVAESLIGQSQAIVHSLPRTRQALRSGELTWRQAQSMVDHTASLSDDHREAVELATVRHAATSSAAAFDRRVAWRAKSWHRSR